MPMSKHAPIASKIKFIANTAFHVYRLLYIDLLYFLSACLELFGVQPPWRSAMPSLGRPAAVGKLHSINVGAGIPKLPVERALVTQLGLAGDRQLVGVVQSWGGHGGSDKAVMLWSLDVITTIAREGHPLCQPGRCGEQLTLAGVDWKLLKTGATVQVGKEVLLEVTFLKLPCASQAANFTSAGDGAQRISPQRYPDSSRVLARVLRAGFVAAGDEVRVYRSPRAAGKLVRSAIYESAFVSEEYNGEPTAEVQAQPPAEAATSDATRPTRRRQSPARLRD